MIAFVSFRQLVKTLTNDTLINGSFTDKDFDEEEHMKENGKDIQGMCLFYIYRALGSVLFGDFKNARLLTEKAIPFIASITGFYCVALHNFLHSISICKTIEEIQNSEEKRKLINVLKANQEWMYLRAKAAPFNFQHLYDLVDAEVKALEGKHDESFKLYEKAALGAKESKRPYHYALACELTGQRYNKTGLERIAGFYLKEAYSGYLAWGAIGKTEAMKEKYQNILFTGMDNAKLFELTSGSTIFTKSINITALTNSIDINAVIKATQTISEEIEKTKLLEKLMRIIIENSGSNRGYILIRDETSWLLSAYQIINNSLNIIIDDRRILLDDNNTKPILPISIISYVIRTKEPVIIGNIHASHYISDNYFIENATSSVMCFPILFHNTLKGIIYLENDLLTEAFTKERVEILNIFASQAAISLENSMLYSHLENKVKGRTRQLKKANAILEEQTAELAIAKNKAEAANKKLEVQNLQLQQEIIVRKRVEEEQRLNLKRLRLSEERFSNLFHSSPIMMTISTPDEDIFYDVNAKFEEITGYSRHEIIGRSFSDLNIWADQSNWTEVIGMLNDKRNIERAIRTKFGEIRTFLISQTIVNFNNEDYWLYASIDITERKKMQREMARLDRLNLVGEMAASIGHEIRNPMTSVRGFLQMFEYKYKEDREFLELMIEELDRANAIITEFLSLAKNKMVELLPKNINSIIKNIFPLVQASARIQDKTIEVKFEHAPDLLLDEKEIRQLLINLIHNGLESMSSGGILTISTFIEEDNLLLSIRDQGHGVNPEILDKLGTPFFTTKEQGTGLGLAVCYGIAERHKAKIDVETSSKGTTFLVRFPIEDINN